GDAMTGKNGELWRQYAVVKLLEWNPARIVVRKSAVNGAPAHFTLHTAKRGDTLAKLALLYYGSASKWKAIGSAQTPRIRDPRRKLTAGKVLRIP
ncbi:MAG TPA: LysM peptidoglycan-binding domain-containing protein, partial [Chloroflexota bacterium]|nr:LysM peptidoglycan-binding domain-containing protein [Chloroflexota bacterium]